MERALRRRARGESGGGSGGATITTGNSFGEDNGDSMVVRPGDDEDDIESRRMLRRLGNVAERESVDGSEVG